MGNEFQELLRKAIGPRRTQAEFAREAGISAAQVSRLLSQVQPVQPQVSTLKRISGHAYGGITLQDLMLSCGYDDTRVRKESNTRRKGAGGCPSGKGWKNALQTSAGGLQKWRRASRCTRTRLISWKRWA